MFAKLFEEITVEIVIVLAKTNNALMLKMDEAGWDFKKYHWKALSSHTSCFKNKTKNIFSTICFNKQQSPLLCFWTWKFRGAVV